MKTTQETVIDTNEFLTSSLKQLSEINLRAYDSIVKGQTEFANIAVRSSLKQVELARDFDNASNYLNAQKDLAKETAKEMIGFTQSSVELATKNRDELFGWVEETAKSASKLNPLANAKAA